MKVIIAGSRNFTDYNFLAEECNKILAKSVVGIWEVVSGTANGADKLGEKFANENGFAIKRFPADWNKHGKSAGYIRNEEMAKYADALIAFWDGKSKGTKHMIDLARKHDLKVKIILTNPTHDQITSNE